MISQTPGLSFAFATSTGWIVRCVLASILAGLSAGLEIGLSANAVAASPSGNALLEKYCFECHGDGAKKGNIALDQLLESLQKNDQKADWEKAWKIVRHEFMPPAGADRPSDAERKAITQWIEAKALGLDRNNPDPGRVTIRRLNRMEYEYTVGDLFEINLNADQDFVSDRASEATKLRDRLPPDDTAFGFDNNGDFLSLSPALLDKFFSLAEYIVDRVVVVGGPRPPELELARAAFKMAKHEETKKVDYSTDFELAHNGTYRMDIMFNVGNFAEIAGTYEFIAEVDGRSIARDEFLIGGHKTLKYSPEVKLAKGSHKLKFTCTPIKADAKGKLNFLEFRPRARFVGPIGAGLDDYPAVHRKIFFRGPAPSELKARREYARAILQRIADRAFRRPATSSTLDRLAEIAMSESQFEKGIGRALTAILASPKFLYRAELQSRPDDPKSIHPIDDFALASRLSYLLWLSIPDEELRSIAAQGKLRENLESQVKRLLADPKSNRFFEDFPGQWLRTRNVLMTAISRADAMLNPVRGSMKKETEMLFEDIARNDRDLIELVTADYTFLDKKLADFYELKGVEGEGFQKVKLSPESNRGGILTHGSFLVSTSNPNRTSPVKRGLFVLENLFATQVPAPPPDIPPLDDAKVGGVTPGTIREQLAAHRENKSCAACHAHFDPIGVVLENFDLIGRWREKENGAPIQAQEKTVTGETLAGISDLRNLFAARKERFYRGITEKLMTYATGRGLEPFDTPGIDKITDQLTSDGGKFSTLLMGVVTSPAFQMRRGDDGVVKTAPRVAMPEPPPPELRKGPRRRFGFNNVDNNRPATNAITNPTTSNSPNPAKP